MLRAKRWNLSAVCSSVVGTGLLMAAWGSGAWGEDPPTPVPSGTVVLDQPPGQEQVLPMNDPDQFAWTLFVKIFAKAKHQTHINGDPKSPMTNNAVWETWPDDPWTFPAKPHPKKPPQWPKDGESTPKELRRAFADSIHGRHDAKAHKHQTPSEDGADVGELAPGGVTAPNGGGVGEEVRRNKATFDFIVENELYYTEGLAAFFAKAAAHANDPVALNANSVNFPRESIEVKANWILISEEQKPRYHWNYNSKGQLCGMVAMHISSKDLPNWFWSTFEHEDNPGIGDYIGIHDSFGADPPHIPSNTTALNAVYPPSSVTPALEKLFQEGGLTGEWGEALKHYKLKGSQIDFTDAAGRPLLLGNSVTEAGFVPTASCITCHSRAAFTAAGTSSFPIFGEKQTLPLISLPQQGSEGSQSSTAITYNGTPDPNWYFQFTGQKGTTLVNLQADFVWAIPFKARPAKTSESEAKK